MGLYKQLGDKLRSQSKSTCETLQECIDLGKTESFAHLNVSYNSNIIKLIQAYLRVKRIK